MTFIRNCFLSFNIILTSLLKKIPDEGHVDENVNK